MNIFEYILFSTATILFFLLMFACFEIYIKYKYGYEEVMQNIGHKEIVKSTVYLFFFLTLSFLSLGILSFVQIIAIHIVATIVRVITIPIFMSDLYWLKELSYWSNHQHEETEEEKQAQKDKETNYGKGNYFPHM